MTIKRKASKSFTDDSPDSSRAICQSCYERGVTTFTVPYIMSNGRPDKGFRSCPFCLALTPIRLTRNYSETQPLGSRSGLGEVHFEVANRSRSRSRRNRQSEPDFDIPKFGNFEDTDLKEMVAGGAQIISITDDYIETSEDC